MSTVLYCLDARLSRDCTEGVARSGRWGPGSDPLRCHPLHLGSEEVNCYPSFTEISTTATAGILTEGEGISLLFLVCSLHLAHTMYHDVCR